MKKDLNICLLLDYYGALLTEKQRRCLGFYYNEDLSLSEIAEIIGGTRQAAQELIRRAEGRLNQMEQQLNVPIAKYIPNKIVKLRNGQA